LVDSGEVPRSWDGADLCPRDTERLGPLILRFLPFTAQSL